MKSITLLEMHMDNKKYMDNKSLKKYNKIIHIKCIYVCICIYIYIYIYIWYSIIIGHGTNEYHEIYNTSDFDKSLKIIRCLHILYKQGKETSRNI